MSLLCEGRVVVVTGAGRGIGRAHVLALAAAGAHVVVNDLGTAQDGTTADASVAESLVQEVVAAGGVAVAHTDDVSTEDGARSLLDLAIDRFGGLDVVINNAGILRDAMLFKMETSAWDAVLAVHLRSTFLTSSYAASIWRGLSKAGKPVDARIINTTSVSGLYGNVGQANYSAAKAAIAAFTIVASRELAAYGVTVNALAPGANTRMTERLLDEALAAALAPEHVAKVAVWLASPESAGVTGRVIDVAGDRISIVEGWLPGPTEQTAAGATAQEVGLTVADLAARARPNALLDGSIPEAT